MARPGLKVIYVKEAEYAEYEKLSALLGKEMGADIKVSQVISMAVSFFKKNRKEKK